MSRLGIEPRTRRLRVYGGKRPVSPGYFQYRNRPYPNCEQIIWVNSGRIQVLITAR
jgi:hypothetical protein